MRIRRCVRLTIGGVTGITITSVEQLFETQTTLWHGGATNRFRFHYSVSGTPFAA
jgi:hypothetical protein